MNRKLIYILLLIFCIFLPKIASLTFGKHIFLKTLESNVEGKIEIGSVEFSWFGPQIIRDIQWSSKKSKAELALFEIKAPFWSFSGPFSLRNGSFSYQKAHIDNIRGTLSNNKIKLRCDCLKGNAKIHGTIYSKLHFQIEIDVHEFPLEKIDPRLYEIIGPTVNLAGSIEMNQGHGKLDLSVDSQNLSTTLLANFQKEGLSLEKPLVADICLTPTLNELLLKDANPLFLKEVKANHPITLTIEKEGVWIPFLKPLTEIQIPKAILDCGKCQLNSGKSLAAIMGLINPEFLTEAKEMDIWFTPIELSMQNGIIDAKRTDILLNRSLHICSWGTVNLLNDELNMKLGLSKSLLQKLFQIKDLPNNYILLFDVIGSINHPHLLKSQAIGKLSALMTRNKKSVLGKFVNLFTSPKQEFVPEPLYPFPWEIEEK